MAANTVVVSHREARQNPGPRILWSPVGTREGVTRQGRAASSPGLAASHSSDQAGATLRSDGQEWADDGRELRGMNARTLSTLLVPLLLAACAAGGPAPHEQAGQIGSRSREASPGQRATVLPPPAAHDASPPPSASASPDKSPPTDAGASPDSSPPPRASAPLTDSPPSNVPALFEIRLRVTKAPELELHATLHNKSNRAQPCFFDNARQPSELELIGPGGRAIEPFDERATAYYDPMVHDWMFRTLGAGEDVELGWTRLGHRDEGSAIIQWGLYRFTNLAPGIYRARVVWRSEVDTCYDDRQVHRRVPDVWIGSVTSNTVQLVVR